MMYLKKVSKIAPMTVAILTRVSNGIFREVGHGRNGSVSTHIAIGEASKCHQCEAIHPRVIIRLAKSTIKLCEDCAILLGKMLESDRLEADLNDELEDKPSLNSLDRQYLARNYR